MATHRLPYGAQQGARHPAPNTPLTVPFQRAPARIRAASLPIRCCASTPAALSSRATGSTAVVIGGSIAGLAAARVASPLFDRVVLLDKDDLTQEACDDAQQAARRRPGVPQFSQFHLLAAGGLAALERLLPGMRDRMVQAGALPVDWGNDFDWFDFGRKRVTFRSELLSVCASRALIETALRAAVREAAPNLSLLAGARVAGFETAAAGDRVTGVKLASGEVLGADLVIDASGRSSVSWQALGAAGWALPEVTTVSANVGYATRFYQVPPGWTGPSQMLVYHHPAAGQRAGTRAGIVSTAEGNRWQVVVMGYAGDHPPGDEEGFMDFCRSLPDASIANAVAAATPASPIMRYARTANQRVWWEKAPPPDGLVVLGDAVAAFNPVYGQGMSVAVMGALALGDCLRERLAPTDDSLANDSSSARTRAAALAALAAVGRTDLAVAPVEGAKESALSHQTGESAAVAAALEGVTAEFQSRLAGVVDLPWSIASGEDLKFVKGADAPQPPLAQRLVGAYFDYVNWAAMDDPVIFAKLGRVMHMLDGPAGLTAPDMVARVAGHWLRERLAGTPWGARPVAAAPAVQAAADGAAIGA